MRYGTLSFHHDGPGWPGGVSAHPSDLAEPIARLGGRESWQEFFDSYWKLIYRAARKAGLGDADAQEVVQEVVVAAAKALPKFQYDPALGSFKGWLLRLTQRRIVDQFRKLPPWQNHERVNSDRFSAEDTSTEERVPDPNAIDIGTFWDLEWRRNLVAIAMDRVKPKVTEKQFQIFDSYVNKEWSVREVCETLKVSAAQVYLTKHRVTKVIRKEMDRIAEKMGE